MLNAVYDNRSAMFTENKHVKQFVEKPIALHSHLRYKIRFAYYLF